MKQKTAIAARGKWRGILQQMGIEGKFLTGKHCPCPLCGGVDRFRFDNKDGSGSFICSQCGAGNGFDLLVKFTGQAFRDVAQRVDQIVGNVEAEPEPVKLDDEARVAMLNRVWKASKPITPTDMAGRYLAGRGIELAQFPKDLRYHPDCRAPNGNCYPTMLAMVRDGEGNPVTIHRTFLSERGKADMTEPRALMPGQLREGSCIRLSPVVEHIGIAEGIETAFRASQRFGLPVWSTINATLMAKWVVPVGVERITIFGDNDAKFGGAAAAYALAHRLAVKGFIVDVLIPDERGRDWADEAA